MGGGRGRGGASLEKYGETPHEEEEIESSRSEEGSVSSSSRSVSVRPFWTTTATTGVTTGPKSTFRPEHRTENIANSQTSKDTPTKDFAKKQSETGKPVKASKAVRICAGKVRINSNTNTAQKRPKKAPDKPNDRPEDTLLIPAGRVSHQSRVKHHRLNGADLYVVRLGRPSTSKPTCCSSSIPLAPIQARTPPDSVADDTDSEISDSSVLSLTSTGSLHEELLNPHPRNPSPGASTPNTSAPAIVDPRTIRSSRPCYRCIEAMHSAGVKRVFWTEDGSLEWRSAKVRDLVAVLDGTGASDGSSGMEQMFVTKHELLMLRRCMVGGNG